MVWEDGANEAGFGAVGRRRAVPREAWLFPQLDPYEPAGRSWSERQGRLIELAESLQETQAEGRDRRLDHAAMPAAYGHLAAFVAHDLTSRSAATLGLGYSSWDVPGRLPRLELDSVYGDGPRAQPYLYDRSDGSMGRLLIGASAEPVVLDVPRNQQGRALIGDPRNDENVILAQLHAAFLSFHNAALTWVREVRGLRDEIAFRKARRLVRWHYQWVVLHDLLKRLVGARLVDALLSRDDGGIPLGLYGRAPRRFVPPEFLLGAYLARFSLLRSTYGVNEGIAPLPLVAADAGLGGGRPIPSRLAVQWDRFVDLDGSAPQASRRLDTILPRWLFQTSRRSTGGRSPLHDFVAGWALGLPSGQDVARALGLPPIRPGHDPLWLYVLHEAEAPPVNGDRLIGVGARIVAEVVIGLLATDPESFLSCDPNWEPVFGPRGRAFDLAELLRFAGVPLSAVDLQLPRTGRPLRPPPTPSGSDARTPWPAESPCLRGSES